MKYVTMNYIDPMLGNEVNFQIRFTGDEANFDGFDIASTLTSGGIDIEAAPAKFEAQAQILAESVDITDVEVWVCRKADGCRKRYTNREIGVTRNHAILNSIRFAVHAYIKEELRLGD